MSQVSQLYDALFSFESSNRISSYPIHKSLELDVRYTDLLDWLLDKVKFEANDLVLDAGCGTGYSLLKLAQDIGISGKGISLAKHEISFAQSQVKQLDLDQQVLFEVASFEDDIFENYDKVLAIESIKHSANLELVLSNLSTCLRDQGTLIIADDFVIEEGHGLLRQHKKLWHVPGFDVVKKTVRILEERGLHVEQFELTNHVPRRSKILLKLLLFLIGLVLGITPKKHRLKVEIYLGGLMLEQLYNLRKVGYFVIIATKT